MLELEEKASAKDRRNANTVVEQGRPGGEAPISTVDPMTYALGQVNYCGSNEGFGRNFLRPRASVNVALAP